MNYESVNINPYMTYNWICIVLCCTLCRWNWTFFCTLSPILFFFVFFFFQIDSKAFLIVYSYFLCIGNFCGWICWFKCILDRSKRITHNNRTYLYEVPTLVWLQSECKLQTFMYKLGNDIVCWQSKCCQLFTVQLR